MKYSILIVDDEIHNLQLLMRTLRKKYKVFKANSAYEAIEVIKSNKINLIISDHKMPVMDGVELLKEVITISPDTVRILITGYIDANALVEGINKAKIFKYLRKPVEPSELIKVVESAFNIYSLNIENKELVMNLKDLFSGTIAAITEALDAKDSFTFGRSKRVTYYSLEIGKALKLTPTELNELELAGLLHDIGMIGIPDDILNKPSNLTKEEFEQVKDHVSLGVKILEEIKQLQNVVNIIKYHHEHNSGSGYPYGISGDEIPIGSKIISIADAYDGMVSDRAYRKGLAHEIAIEEIEKKAEAQFDKKVVDAFLSIIDQVREHASTL